MSQIEKDVLPHIPVGKSNAASPLVIWRHVECWSAVGVRNALALLAARREIGREKELIPGGFRWVYWRDAAVALLALLLAADPTRAAVTGHADRLEDVVVESTGEGWLDTGVDPPIFRISTPFGWVACQRTSLPNVHLCGDALVDSTTGSVVQLPPEYRAEGGVP